MVEAANAAAEGAHTVSGLAPKHSNGSARADGQRSDAIDPLPNDLRMPQGFAVARNPVARR